MLLTKRFTDDVIMTECSESILKHCPPLHQGEVKAIVTLVADHYITLLHNSGQLIAVATSKIHRDIDNSLT